MSEEEVEELISGDEEEPTFSVEDTAPAQGSVVPDAFVIQQAQQSGPPPQLVSAILFH